MIHYISFPAKNTLHVAQVLTQLFNNNYYVKSFFDIQILLH